MRSEMKNDLLSLIPSLRAFAVCLTQDLSRADELVLSSLVEIWSSHAGKERAALKLAAFKTVRRQFLLQGTPDALLLPAFAQPRLAADEDAFAIRLARLPRTEREAVSLIEVWGFDHSQAAEICGCDRKTIDNRIGMARRHLSARSSLPISFGAFRGDTAAVHASAA